MARAAARAPRIAVITAAESSPRVSMSLLIVGSEATAPNNSGWAPIDRGIGQAVTAQRDRHRQIQHRLARIMHRSRRPPRTQRVRELLGQSADLGRLKQ